MTSRAARRIIQESERQRKAVALMSGKDDVCEIYLVRHGETDWNVEHRLQGQLHPGPPLNDRGIQQAHSLAARLAEFTFDALYSSDLLRTIQTAEIVLLKTLTVPVGRDHTQELKELRERYLGCLQGMTLAEARQMHPDLVQGLGSRKSNGAAEVAGIESLTAMQERVASVLERIAAAHPNQRVLVLAHGGVLHAAYHKATGADPKSGASNCAINVLQIESINEENKKRHWAVVKWDEEERNDGANSFGGGHTG